MYLWYPRSNNCFRWKETIEQRMRKVEESLRLGTNQQDGFSSTTPESQTSLAAVSDTNMEPNNPDSTSIYERPETASDVTLNLSCSLGSFPGSSIITLTFTEQEKQLDYKPDLISSCLITFEAAEEYFTIYQKSMERCIYQILAGGRLPGQHPSKIFTAHSRYLHRRFLLRRFSKP